jgi:SAM-dependent methyltransferase
MQDLRPGMALSNARLRRAELRRGVPVPPGRLIYLSTTLRDVAWFLDGGARTAAEIRAALERIGRPIGSFDSVLDFGCGCGRVLRQWSGVNGPTFTGTDYNPAGPDWINEHLPGVSAKKNGLEPPLPFENESFDLVYSVSVFTHLPVELQEPWLVEIRRVLRPGGIFLPTLMGQSFAEGRLDEADMRQFGGGGTGRERR